MPVIRVARRTQLWLEKRHIRPLVAPKAGKLLISTRRRELNQASMETYSRWENPTLVSRGWKHRTSCGDYFTINRQREHRVWPETEDTFRALNLDLRVVLALEASNITTPTWAQKEVIPSLLRGRSVLCASETGSGKTLAYLLPIMHKLLTQNEYCSGNPRSLVLVPSRELAGQVTSVARRLGSHLGITVHFLGGGRGRRVTEKQLKGVSVDLLVATPGILWKGLNWNKISLTDLQYIVLDEADTLFDKTFCYFVESILMHTQIASHAKEAQGHDRKAQFAIIGATVPKGVGEILSKVMDLGSIHIIKSGKLHLLMPHVQHTFKKVTGADKVPEVLQMLKQHAAEKHMSGIFIFCNTSKTVNWLSYILDDHGIKHTRLHGQMPAEMRLGIFEAFQKGQTDVLVCTNIASRGLDSCRVGTVVNFDFPFTIEDYLHRAGRVGRVGSRSQGSVLSFVTHSWDVEQVQTIETAVRMRTYLPGMKSKLNDFVPNKKIKN
ncbi:PREDICTED: probable ATP-dependent RNA helicase DDX28 [Nanorana parkeri]|uniref:probable ATP-dependent RNA helicase DDX28 n=1 Tax=Nanorana parkeri TaxID=125878 RepID=UPI000854A458|nr:PREDICTED: probable ATP-dependent RNA helicase DDX28 [Nanorana parkeri]